MCTDLCHKPYDASVNRQVPLLHLAERMSLPLIALRLDDDDGVMDIAVGPMEKQKDPAPKPYAKGGKGKGAGGVFKYKGKLTPEQRKFLDTHWQDGSWRDPQAPPSSKPWTRVKKEDVEEWALLENAKERARELSGAKDAAGPSANPEEAPSESGAGGSGHVSDSPGSNSAMNEDAAAEFVPVPFEEEALTDQQLKERYPVNFPLDVLPMMDADPQYAGWRTLEEAERRAATDGAKLEWRKRKHQAVNDANRKAHEEAQAAAKQAHDSKAAIMADLKKKKAGLLMDESATDQQKYRAILRFHFQKKGTDKKMRYWSKTGPGASQTQDPTPDPKLVAARKKWAIDQISKMKELDNPLEFLLSLPFPPLELYQVVAGKGDVIPSNHPSLLASGSEQHAMPPFQGAVTAIAASDAPSGLKVFYYVKTNEQAFASMNPPLFPASYFPPIGKDFGAIKKDPESVKLRNEIDQALRHEYEGFLNMLVDFGANAQSMFGGTNEAYSYTEGSGRWNRTLRVPFSLAMPHKPNKPTYQKSVELQSATQLYDAMRADPTTDNNGPEMKSAIALRQISMHKIHALWRMFAVAPRLPVDTFAMRAMRHRNTLPHVLAGIKDDAALVPGMAFLDQAFISTAMATPYDYISGPLAAFYSSATKCCFMSLTIKAGTPAIPIYIREDKLTAYKGEKELVLPPLCVYVFRQKTVYAEGQGQLNGAEIYHYDVYTFFGKS
jgi:hypothetical protein